MKKTTEEGVSSEEKSKERDQKKKALQKQREQEAADPIGTLTVARLKEILRSRGLKVSGNKKELQDRLRAQVQSMLKKNMNETLSS
jgi:molecular chaperone DnaK (HSP70)